MKTNRAPNLLCFNSDRFESRNNQKTFENPEIKSKNKSFQLPSSSPHGFNKHTMYHIWTHSKNWMLVTAVAVFVCAKFAEIQ